MAERCVSLLASATEILYGLGLGDRVVAVSHECDYPSEVNNKPRVTFTNLTIDAPSTQIDEEVKRLSTTGTPIYSIDVKQKAGRAATRPDRHAGALRRLRRQLRRRASRHSRL